MKKKFSKKDIIKYLGEVNKKLEQRGKFGELVLCGGAVFTLIYETRNSTRDIDAVFNPREELKEIIDEITRENNLDSQWLNDDVSMFTVEFKNLTSSEYLRLSHLTVGVLKAETLLSMKLISARTDTYDLDDTVTLIKHLKIKKVEELYAMIERCEFPLHPTALKISENFAKQAFDVYMKNNPEFLHGQEANT